MKKWLWISLIVVVLDQATKIAAEQMLVMYEPVAVIPGLFNMNLMYNTGAAFSFLSDAGGWQRYLFVALSAIISAFLVGWLWNNERNELERNNHLLQLAIALVLGGAVGNLIDRAMTGAVVDFIQVYYDSYYFPTFNIADSAISIGAALLIIDMFRQREHTDEEREGQA